MRPNRTVALRRITGASFFLFAALAGLLGSGCAGIGGAGGSEACASLSEAEARRAGALALYSKGLLLESGDGSETNANRTAAADAFQQACLLDPDNPRPLASLLSSLNELARHAEALERAERFLARNPSDTEIRVEAARAADAAGRPADAARHCAALMAADPDNRELAAAQIRLLFQAGDEQAALAALAAQHTRFADAASAALPVQWALHFTRDEANPGRGLSCARLAADLHTNASERAALTALIGECQLLLGQTNAAERSFSEAYLADPESVTPLLRLGAVLATQTGATNRLACRAAAGTAPEADLARLLLAATLQALGDRPAAAAELRRAYTARMQAGLFPDEGFYLWLGSLYESDRRLTDAERLFTEALAVHPDSHEMKNFLAYMWAEQGVRLDRAAELVNAALLALPDNAAYLDTKGWIRYRQGRLYEAAQLLLRAAELDREEPVILDHAGDALFAIGREAEAIALWKRSHASEPKPEVAEKLRRLGEPPATP